MASGSADLDALLTTFVAALLGEFGDKTQLLAILLGAHFRRPLPVLLGIASAATLNSAIAAAGAGAAIAFMPHRATTLLVAMALILAGAGALLPAKPPRLETYARIGAFPTSLFAFLVLEFGDKTQFLTFALAARSGEPALAAAGAAAGVIAASIPAVVAGRELSGLPLDWIRRGAGSLFLLLGAWAAIDGLNLT